MDTVGNPTSLRLVGNLSWSLRGWTVQGTVNYTGAYRDPGSVPVRKVDSWTTVDVNIGYRVDGGSGWHANTQFNLEVNNAFDQRPPFVNQFDLPSGTLGYDPATAGLLGRQVSLQVVKQWGGSEPGSSQSDDGSRRPGVMTDVVHESSRKQHPSSPRLHARPGALGDK